MILLMFKFAKVKVCSLVLRFKNIKGENKEILLSLVNDHPGPFIYTLILSNANKT
jgi:hypothetical protein